MQPGARYLAVVGGFLLAGLVLGLGVAARTASQSRPPALAAPLQSPPPAPPAVTRPLAPSTPSPDALATPPLETATPVPLTVAAPLPSRYGPNRLIIPTLGINSTWLPLGYLPNGITMDSPPGPQDLGWYAFTAQPGSSSNAVFAGHVDWYTGAPALFAHLSTLGPGSEIDVSRADGSLATYQVVSAIWYDLYQTPAAPIIAATSVPTVTLITCGGTFDNARHEYDKRLVVRAVATN